MDQYSDIHTPEDSRGTEPDLRGTILRERRAGILSSLEHLFSRFSGGERLALYALAAALCLSAFLLLANLNAAISVEVPARGGSLTEGEIGPARFINPVIVLSQADEDLSELVYSGLTRARPDGTFIPDLAEHYDISADGTVYTFILRKGLTFQDGSPITSADVLFTIALAQNPDIKSSHRADWEGVTATAPDDHTVIFTLPHAYAPFIENTTLGILPKHLWQNVTPDEFHFNPLNTHPIGSGPYKVSDVKTDSTGAATRYDLVPFDEFALGAAHISRISFVFFSNQETLAKAFGAGQIDSMAGVMPSDLAATKRTGTLAVHAPLPRVFAVFLNQSHDAALSDASARTALDAAVDKQAIVDSVLQGYGKVLQGPVPPEILGSFAPSRPSSITVATSAPHAINADATFADAARAMLSKGGWTMSSSTNLWTKSGKGGSGSGGKTTLSLKLATVDEPELVATAQALANDWRAAGIHVDVQVYPVSEFNTGILRPRDYDAILFGEVVGRAGDFFAFWHSSQRNDPGLNLAMYANSKADALLAQARATTNKTERDNLYTQFETIIEKDQPAVFLYSPEFIYMVPRGISGIELGAITVPAERFLNVYEWYGQTERVWSFFTDKANN